MLSLAEREGIWRGLAEGVSLRAIAARTGRAPSTISREVARNGETVIALVDGENATVKQYQRRGAVILLMPANPTMSPLEYPEERVRVQGVVIGVLRLVLPKAEASKPKQIKIKSG